MTTQITTDDYRYFAKHGCLPPHVENHQPAPLPVEANHGRKAPVSGVMNKLEESYSRELEGRRVAREILGWMFEPMKLRLATKTFYTIDFLVILPGAMELHEVKGHWEDDARVKIKVAAEKFWMYRFVAVTKKRGAWKFEEFASLARPA